jgi:hypothetical protein
MYPDCGVTAAIQRGHHAISCYMVILYTAGQTHIARICVARFWECHYHVITETYEICDGNHDGIMCVRAAIMWWFRHSAHDGGRASTLSVWASVCTILVIFYRFCFISKLFEKNWKDVVERTCKGHAWTCVTSCREPRTYLFKSLWDPTHTEVFLELSQNNIMFITIFLKSNSGPLVRCETGSSWAQPIIPLPWYFFGAFSPKRLRLRTFVLFN